MGSVLEYVLDGLEEALELERELGVRVVEVDRALLVPPAVVPAAPAKAASAPPKPAVLAGAPRPHLDAPPSPAVVPSAPPSGTFDYIFVHDRPLPPGGVEMMAKIVTALGGSAETTPIVIAPPLPASRMVVILGSRALKKFYPDLRGEPGQWLKTADGREALVTYSPEYILRFDAVTPAVMKIKGEMWRSLKAVRQRCPAKGGLPSPS